MEKTNVIKLKYLRAGQPSGREYTFYTPAPVEVGDIVDIAVVSPDNTSQGMVTAVNVPLEEIEAFKDRAKTIIGKAAPKVEAEETEQKAQERADRKLQYIIGRYGDANGERRKPYYREQLIQEAKAALSWEVFSLAFMELCKENAPVTPTKASEA